MPRSSTSPSNLIVPRAEAAQKIQAQIEKGRKIKNLVINSEADKVVEHWAEFDLSNLMRQLGVAPPPQQSKR